MNEWKAEKQFGNLINSLIHFIHQAYITQNILSICSITYSDSITKTNSIYYFYQTTCNNELESFLIPVNRFFFQYTLMQIDESTISFKLCNINILINAIRFQLHTCIQISI